MICNVSKNWIEIIKGSHISFGKDSSHPIKQRWMNVLISTLLVLLTYPSFEPDFGLGLDSSYVWGLNWLFEHDYNTLISLIYPYGPFAWLKIPTIEGLHFPLFLAFYTMIKFIFVMLTTYMATSCGLSRLLTIVVLLPACVMGNIDTYIVLSVCLLSLLCIDSSRILPFLGATILSIFSLTIKTSIGVEACAVLFVGWLIYSYKYRDIKKSTVLAIMVPIIMILIGLLVYHNLSNMWTAYTGMLHMLGGYGPALVLMVEHRLWALILFWVSIIVLVFFSKGHKSFYVLLMVALPLFANWKYGILREDFYHFRQLVAFFACVIAVVLATQRSFNWKTWVCGFFALTMLFINLQSLRTDSALVFSTSSPTNVVRLTAGYKKLVDQSRENIAYALSQRQLSDSLRHEIGVASVDCYPWEFTYIAANTLKWQPRITLGAGLSPALSEMASANYYGENAVDYIILHRLNTSTDGILYSLDGAYLLNDEPAVLQAMLSNYQVADSGWYGILLRRRTDPVSTSVSGYTTVDAGWDSWVGLPSDSADFMEVSIKESLLGRIVGFIYKPDIYIIDYLMPDSTVCSYRFSPLMCESGLWIGQMASTYSDLIDLFGGSYTALRPIAVRFRSIHPSYHMNNLALHFVYNEWGR